MDNALLFQQAQQATRVRDEVLGIVVHDLRNPLNAIMLMAHEESSSAELILRAADRMNRLRA